jgi:hypothetical protein
VEKIKGAKKWLSPTITLITLLGLSLFPLSANAQIIDFIIDPSAGSPPSASGSISYGGGANPLVGTSIEVDRLVGISTPANAGVPLTCVACVLGFTTGNFVSSSLQTWTFSGGGIITLTGAIPSIGIGTSTTLFTGSFLDSPFVSRLGGDLKLAGGGIADTKDQTLTSFFGLPNVPYLGGVNVQFQAPGVPPSAFSSRVILSGDVANTPIPEPGTLLLIGSGLVGIGVGARRRSRQK